MKLKTLTALSIGAFTLAYAMTPVLASTSCSGDTTTTNTCVEANDIVTINNSATVENCITSTASTGGNYAGGSIAGNGGNGGNAMLSAEQAADPKGGNGGDGGSVGTGGQITTGDASVGTEVKNDVNYVEVSLERKAPKVEAAPDCDTDCDDHDKYCKCSKCGTKDTTNTTIQENNIVTVNNCATVKNVIASDAKTGDNMAEGSIAGNGGDGGHAHLTTAEADACGCGKSSETAPVIGGNGGKGGSVEAGGIIATGKANTYTTLFNLINKAFTRIVR